MYLQYEFLREKLLGQRVCMFSNLVDELPTEKICPGISSLGKWESLYSFDSSS